MSGTPAGQVGSGDEGGSPPPSAPNKRTRATDTSQTQKRRKTVSQEDLSAQLADFQGRLMTQITQLVASQLNGRDGRGAGVEDPRASSPPPQPPVLSQVGQVGLSPRSGGAKEQDEARAGCPPPHLPPPEDPGRGQGQDYRDGASLQEFNDPGRGQFQDLRGGVPGGLAGSPPGEGYHNPDPFGTSHPTGSGALGREQGYQGYRESYEDEWDQTPPGSYPRDFDEVSNVLEEQPQALPPGESDMWMADRLAQVEGLEGFALPGMAPAFPVRKPTIGPTSLQDNMWVAARGGDTQKRVPIDKMESLYKTGAGSFQAPPLPQGLVHPDDKQALATDASLRDIQDQWGAMGLAIARGVTHIEEVVRGFQEKAKAGECVTAEEVMAQTRKLAVEAVRPLSHAFRIAAARFNIYQSRRKDRLAQHLDKQDSTLSRAVKEAPLSTRSFFTVSLEGPIKAATDRRANKELIRSVLPPHRDSRQNFGRPAPPARASGQARNAPAYRHPAPAAQGRSNQQASTRPFRGRHPGSQGSRGRCHYQPSNNKAPSQD